MATPSALRGNDVLTFLLELAVHVAVVAAALRLPTGAPGKALVAVGAVLVLAVAWGRFAAPRASAALHGAPRVAFEVAWFGTGVVAAGIAAGWWAAAAFAVLSLLSGVLRAARPRIS